MKENVATDAFGKMDSIYRYQRYFYDATRKFYLLGRDTLIRKMPVTAGDRIAEIGCGTGRNLQLLAKMYPEANFYGLDASSEMLVTARANISRLDNVHLKTALADDFDSCETFCLNEKFDTIFFSYSISMIPMWREAIECALSNLKPGGNLFIVDFYDQMELPGWFRVMLRGWLRKFHVQFWNELIPHLYDLHRAGKGILSIESISRRYAFIVTFKKADDY